MSKELKNTIIVFAILAVVAVAFFYNNDAPDYSKDGSSTPTQTQQVQNTNQNNPPAETTKKVIIATAEPEPPEGTIGDYMVTIEGSRVTNDEKGNRVLVVTFNYTNNSEKANSWNWTIGATAFQNSVQIEEYSDYGDLYDNLNHNYNSEILPGYSVLVDRVYILSDNASDVVIKIDEKMTVYPQVMWERIQISETPTEMPPENIEHTELKMNIGDLLVSIEELDIYSYRGEDYLIVTYIYTNNSNDTKNLGYNIDDKAFQNGIEMKDVFLSTLPDDAIKYDNLYKETMPGTTIRAQAAYRIENINEDMVLQIQYTYDDDNVYRWPIPFSRVTSAETATP